MGERCRHRGAWHAARGVIALTIACALIVAPLVVILTHGPAAHAAAASAIVDPGMHGHDHGPAHDDAAHDRHGGPFGGHNPADHDHQLHALIGQPGNAPKPLAGESSCAFSDVFRNLTLDGPIRPPRRV